MKGEKTIQDYYFHFRLVRTKFELFRVIEID